jgi:hypothetical protein
MALQQHQNLLSTGLQLSAPVSDLIASTGVVEIR